MIQQIVNIKIPFWYLCRSGSWLFVCVYEWVSEWDIHPQPEKTRCGGVALDSVSHTVSTSHESVKQTCWLSEKTVKNAQKCIIAVEHIRVSSLLQILHIYRSMEEDEVKEVLAHMEAEMGTHSQKLKLNDHHHPKQPIRERNNVNNLRSYTRSNHTKVNAGGVRMSEHVDADINVK